MVYRSGAVLLENARVVDGTGSTPRENMSVEIVDGKVKQVTQQGQAKTENATRFNLDGKTVMPGLIDAHTHLTYHKGEYGLIFQQMQESREFNTLKAAENAEHILSTGCTAIGDGGTRGKIASAIRDAVRKGLIPGPKVVAAGQMLSGSAGIHDQDGGWGHYDPDVFLGRIVNGPDEVRKAVREQVRSGVDWVKLTASGLPGTPWIDGHTPDLSFAEIQAAVEEAAKFQKTVHAHAHDQRGIAASAQAGVISLHSGEFATKKDLEVLRDTGCVFVPTIAWLHFRTNEDYAREYMRARKPSDAEVQRFIDECREAYERCQEAVQMAYEMEVPTAIGTDAAHVFPPFNMVFEMEYIQDLGVPASTVIHWATEMSARAIGREDVWGSIEVGKDADLLVVDGRPDEDVGLLRKPNSIGAIIQNGALVGGSLKSSTNDG